jgi:hypothetical protein
MFCGRGGRCVVNDSLGNLARVSEEGTDDRGCEFCADETNLLYGHVPQVGSSEGRRTVLLRCPRCGSWYEQDPDSGSTIRRDEQHARAYFPDSV